MKQILFILRCGINLITDNIMFTYLNEMMELLEERMLMIKQKLIVTQDALKRIDLSYMLTVLGILAILLLSSCAHTRSNNPYYECGRCWCTRDGVRDCQ